MDIVTRQAYCAVVAGKSKTDRKVSVVDQVTDLSTLASIASFGGKAGKAAMAHLAMPAAVEIATQCASSNYGGVANVVAAVRGTNFIVNRAVFHALPALIDGWLQDQGLTKSQGFRVEKKTGLHVPNAERVGLLTLRAWIVDVIQASEKIREDRAAEAAERKAAEQRQLANEASE